MIEEDIQVSEPEGEGQLGEMERDPSFSWGALHSGSTPAQPPLSSRSSGQSDSGAPGAVAGGSSSGSSANAGVPWPRAGSGKPTLDLGAVHAARLAQQDSDGDTPTLVRGLTSQDDIGMPLSGGPTSEPMKIIIEVG